MSTSISSVTPTVTTTAPVPTTAPAPTTAQKNWLQNDLLSQTQKNAVGIDLSSQLAKLLRDRTDYEQQSGQNAANAQRQAQDTYRSTAESYAARGLSSSTPYLQADDRAFQQAQLQQNDIATQLSSYLANYAAAGGDAKLKAEQQKSSIDAEALQRYAQQLIGRVGQG